MVINIQATNKVIEMKDKRTVDDLSEEEYEDYEKNPEKYEDVTQNTIDLYRGMMCPDGQDE